jgi:predicted nucleic acid-binding protein
VAEYVLADTSVWVDHLRRRNAELVGLLEAEAVCIHPFVIGELACGNLAQRATILALLAELPQATTLEHGRVLTFLSSAKLMGRGIGWVDVNLLASAVASGRALWTLDRRLAAAAAQLGAARRHK